MCRGAYTDASGRTEQRLSCKFRKLLECKAAGYVTLNAAGEEVGGMRITNPNHNHEANVVPTRQRYALSKDVRENIRRLRRKGMKPGAIRIELAKSDIAATKGQIRSAIEVERDTTLSTFESLQMTRGVVDIRIFSDSVATLSIIVACHELLAALDVRTIKHVFLDGVRCITQHQTQIVTLLGLFQEGVKPLAILITDGAAEVNYYQLLEFAKVQPSPFVLFYSDSLLLQRVGINPNVVHIDFEQGTNAVFYKCFF